MNCYHTSAFDLGYPSASFSTRLASSDLEETRTCWVFPGRQLCGLRDNHFGFLFINKCADITVNAALKLRVSNRGGSLVVSHGSLTLFFHQRLKILETDKA